MRSCMCVYVCVCVRACVRSCVCVKEGGGHGQGEEIVFRFYSGVVYLSLFHISVARPSWL